MLVPWENKSKTQIHDLPHKEIRKVENEKIKNLSKKIRVKINEVENRKQ